MFNKIKKYFQKQSQEYEIPEIREVSPVERMKQLEQYFQRHIASNASFEPEFEAARQINHLAGQKELSDSDMIEMVKIYNATNAMPHYNGSGWLDFRMQILTILRKNGFPHQTLPNGDINLSNENV